MIRTDAPRHQCISPDPHEEHLWARHVSGSKATSADGPGTWRWAHCLGVNPHERGWWNMTCFNGLSPEQQYTLVTRGNLEMGYKPGGDCHNPAEVEVATMWDEYPGPRFYCRTCAITFLTEKKWSVK